MRKTFFLIFLTCTFSQVIAQTKIFANISGLQNDNGVCRACLFTTASSFSSGDQPFQCLLAKVDSKTAKINFENIPPGVYALLVFHDANNNHKMDKNFLGIPKEGYGASKNKLPFASAPSFSDNKFSVSLNTVTHLNIKVRNL